MRSKNKISIIIAAALLVFPSLVFAAGSPAKGESYNMVLISLISLMLILLFVIGMLANTLRVLSGVARDKIRKDRQSTGSNIAKALLLVLALSFPALGNAAEAVTKAAAPASNYISGIPADDYYLIISVLLLELIVIFALVMYIGTMLKILKSKPETATAGAVAAPQESWFWDKFNAAATLEKERDILMDHDYDGIKELDNSLPPWWKYGFYITIMVACVYIYRFHISHDGMSSKEEYVEAMEQGEADKAAYLATAGNNVDENTVKMLTEPNEIAAGKELFGKNCIACHLADGGGVVGPNLTDEYWLHGGSMKDIFKTIKYGWQEKGMKSWKDDFSAKQIQQLASYVKSLKGTHPAVPKAAQGELYIEAAVAAPATDSTKKGSDSTKVEKSK